MNLRIASAFWYSHTTRTWPALLLGLLLGSAVVLFAAPTYNPDIDDTYTLLIFTLVITLPAQLLGLLYNASLTDSLTCRLPESTLLLPVSTWSIAFHRFAFNIASVAITTLILYGLVYTLEPPAEPWWEWVLHVAALVAFLQVVALAVAPTGDWTIGFLVGGTWYYSMLNEFFRDEVRVWTPEVLHIATLVVCLPLTWLVIGIAREGAWQSAGSVRMRERVSSTAKTRALKPFKSAWRAQFWLELRRYARPIFRIYIVLSMLYLAVMLIVGISDGDYGPFRLNFGQREAHFFIMGYLGFAAAAFGGIVIALQNRRMQLGPAAAFLYIRPFSTADFTSARIVAALCVWFPLVMISVTWAALVEVLFNSEHTDPAVAILPWFVAAITPMAALLWGGLWTWNILAVTTLWCATLLATVVFSDRTWAFQFLGYVFTALVVLITLAAFVKALRERLVGWKTFILVPAIVLILVFEWTHPLVEGVRSAIEWNQSLSVGVVLYHLALSAFLVAPFATIPLAHHWCRHR